MAKNKTKKTKSVNVNTIIIAAVIIVSVIVCCTVFREEIGAAIKNSASGGNDDGGKLSQNPSVLGGSVTVNLPVELDDIGLEIFFIDVGQGDSIVIRLPDGKDMIIDAGSGTSASAAKIDAYLDYLSLINIDYFDYMLVTHPDADHINMLDDVLNAYSVQNIYLNGITADTAAFTALKTYIDAEGAVVIEFDSDGDVYNISGDGYQIGIYAPGYQRFEDANSMSPIVTVEYAGRKIVLTGDAHDETEQWFMENAVNFDCDVLKVGHHGSKSSSSADFLSFIKPEYAVISVGKNNTYGHPMPEIMNRLFDLGTVTYRTDRHGNVVLYVDADGDFAFGVTDAVPVENNRNLVNDRMITEPNA